MNERIDALHPYPFEKLRTLVAGIEPNPALKPLSLGIGEPQHEPPQAVLDALTESALAVAKYPATLGQPELRQTIADWATRRFAPVQMNASQVIPVTGTREALFAVIQALVGQGQRILMPNPFYQIYEGAAIMAGATPCYLNAEADNDFAPMPADVDSFENVAAVFLCTPGNPSGRVLSVKELQAWIEAAQTHNFLLISDECYSEIYRDEQSPPPGLLQAAAEMGASDLNNCIAVGSLSKRSNLPGLRSGYMIGSAAQMAEFAKYRTYHGCAMPGHHQQASIVAWNDEAHVKDNREQYRQKYAMAQHILSDYLPSTPPEGGFYLWIEVPGGDDEGFTQLLLRDYNLRVLPGRYLGRDVDGHNPGAGRVRVALVSATETTQEALKRLKSALDDWSQSA